MHISEPKTVMSSGKYQTQFTVTLGLPEGIALKVAFDAPAKGVSRYELFDENGSSMGSRSHGSGYDMKFALADDINVLLEEHGKQINALDESFGIMCNRAHSFATAQYHSWSHQDGEITAIIN